VATDALTLFKRAQEKRRQKQERLDDHHSSLYRQRLDLFQPVLAAWAQLSELVSITSSSTGTQLDLEALDGHMLTLEASTTLPDLKIYCFEAIGQKQTYLPVPGAIKYLAEWCAEHEPLE
jgi:hypothetical protein